MPSKAIRSARRGLGIPIRDRLSKEQAGRGWNISPAISGTRPPGNYASDLSILGYGVLGVSTHPDDMPATGTASYAGHARTKKFDFSEVAGVSYGGAATAEANFGAGTVDVVTTAVASIGGATELRMDGAEIDGNAFDGGTITIWNGDTDVTATYLGTLVSLDGAGMFYGPVEGGASDEIGGWMLTIGTESSLLTHFLAD